MSGFPYACKVIYVPKVGGEQTDSDNFAVVPHVGHFIELDAPEHGHSKYVITEVKHVGGPGNFSCQVKAVFAD